MLNNDGLKELISISGSMFQIFGRTHLNKHKSVKSAGSSKGGSGKSMAKAPITAGTVGMRKVDHLQFWVKKRPTKRDSQNRWAKILGPKKTPRKMFEPPNKC